MAHPATFLILPSCKHSAGQNDVLQSSGSFLTQSLEDLCLAKRIERALHATGHNVLREIEVFVTARIVRLVGRVPSYYLKQVAQVTALAIPGTHQIHNDLEVITPK